MPVWTCPRCRKPFEIPEGWEPPKSCADCSKQVRSSGPPKPPIPSRMVQGDEIPAESSRKVSTETTIPLKYKVPLWIAHGVSMAMIIFSAVFVLFGLISLVNSDGQKYVTHQSVLQDQGFFLLTIGFGLFVSAEIVSLMAMVAKKLVQIEICVRS